MVDTTGISGPEDITSIQKARQLLEVDADASESEVQSAYQDAVLETHPDTGGDAELFKAVDDAKDIIDGEIDPAEGPDSGGTRPGTGPSRSGPTDPGGASTQGQGATGGSGTGFGGFGASRTRDDDGPDREVILNGVRNLLRQNTDEETLKDKYGPNASMENVAEILTDLIIAGGIELGDIRKMLNDEFEFGSNLGDATGGLFGGSSTSGNIFGGGSGLGSSDPRDYMSYGAGKGFSGDDDDDDA